MLQPKQTCFNTPWNSHLLVQKTCSILWVWWHLLTKSKSEFDYICYLSEKLYNSNSLIRFAAQATLFKPWFLTTVAHKGHYTLSHNIFLLCPINIQMIYSTNQSGLHIIIDFTNYSTYTALYFNSQFYSLLTFTRLHSMLYQSITNY